MTEEMLKALDCGVLGLCAIMVVFAAGVIYREQSSERPPKPGLLKLVYVFIGFCVFLVGVNAYMQTQQQTEKEKLLLLSEKLNQIDEQLEDKSYTELSSLAATADPVIKERLDREIQRLRQTVAEAKNILAK